MIRLMIAWDIVKRHLHVNVPKLPIHDAGQWVLNNIKN